jgi:hypothetical protein
MITGGRLAHVDVRKDSEEPVKGLSINISINDVVVKGENVEVKYTYVANYAEKVGVLTMSGSLFAKEDAKKAKEIGDTWQKTKKLPDEFAELALNNINYACGTNGVLITRAIGLMAPLAPPTITLSKAAK